MIYVNVFKSTIANSSSFECWNNLYINSITQPYAIAKKDNFPNKYCINQISGFIKSQISTA